MDNSLEKSSIQKMDFPIKAYLKFCKIYKLNPLIQNKKDRYLQLERYTVWRLKMLQGTGGTASSDLTSIQHWFATHGMHSDIKNEHRPIQKIIKAANKLHPPTDQTTRPIQNWEIKAIFKLLPKDKIDPVVVRAAWAVALTTALRSEEFLAHTTDGDAPERTIHYIRKERVCLWEPTKNSNRKHFGVIWFWKSKTNHTFKKEFATLACGCDIGVCAIVELKRLFKFMKNPKKQTAIFTWKDGTYFTAQQSRDYLKKYVQEIGASPEKIGNHSLKKACITMALQKKTPDGIAVQLARWKSFQSLRSYINLNPRQLIEARLNYNKEDNEINRFRQFVWKER